MCVPVDLIWVWTGGDSSGQLEHYRPFSFRSLGQVSHLVVWSQREAVRFNSPETFQFPYRIDAEWKATGSAIRSAMAGHNRRQEWTVKPTG